MTLRGRAVFSIGQLGWIVALLLTIGFGALANARLTERPLFAVALENLRLAHTLSVTGVYGAGVNEKEAVRPSVARDVLYPAALSLWLSATLPERHILTSAEINTSKSILVVKRLNVVLLALTGLLVFLSARDITRGVGFAVTAEVAFFGLLSAVNNRNYTDSATVEPIAMLLTVLFSLLTYRALQGRSIAYACGAGAVLAGSVLAKGIFLYAIPFTAGAVLVLWYLQTRNWRSSLGIGVVFVVIPACIVVPWMYRNYELSGDFKTANGGGIVIYYRALLDTMEEGDYRGLFYTFTPKAARWLVGPVLGYTPADLQPDGRLRRLAFENREIRAHDDKAAAEARPEDTITYRMRINAEAKKRHQLRSGPPDRTMQADALKIIANHPLAHLALVLPVVWQGMWMDSVPFWAAPFLFWAVIAAAIAGAYRRDYALMGICILPLLNVGAYGMMTHFIPRYSVPMMPVMILCFAYLVHVVARRFTGSRSSSLANPASG
jgi:4-amino-4-deoxy-L-arabinose transferase-like glycosyltransferase